MKKAIAMRCTQEQYEKIKSKLIKNNVEINSVTNFEAYPYLANCDGCAISNVDLGFHHVVDEAEVFETWNETIFLNACGIETEPEYVITQSEMEELKHLLADDSHSGHYLRIEITKNILPHLFKEDKVELQVGRWYISEYYLLNKQDGNNCYGISLPDSVWEDKLSHELRSHINGGYREATPEEVTEALTKEAVKLNLIAGEYAEFGTEKEVRKIGESEYTWSERLGCFYVGSDVLMGDGIWAKHVQTITKEEAEALLNKKIV